MIRIAHIINPVIVEPSSDLFIAQPITFATIQTAKECAKGILDVEVFTTQYSEDRSIIPPGFVITQDLERSVLDFGDFKIPRRLPLIRDILDRLYEAAVDADYMIYTNVDIAVMPHFYLAVSTLINQGFDAFTINRRTITNLYASIDQIPLMTAQVGEAHRGHDCFIFPRQSYPKFYFPNMCLGASNVGMAVLINMLYNARRFELFSDLHLTFHIGNNRIHHSPALQDYKSYNNNEFLKLLEHYDILEHPHEHEIIERISKNFAHPKRFSNFRSKLGRVIKKVRQLSVPRDGKTPSD